MRIGGSRNSCLEGKFCDRSAIDRPGQFCDSDPIQPAVMIISDWTAALIKKNKILFLDSKYLLAFKKGVC